MWGVGSGPTGGTAVLGGLKCTQLEKTRASIEKQQKRRRDQQAVRKEHQTFFLPGNSRALPGKNF
jgi:hypothetical protein